MVERLSNPAFGLGELSEKTDNRGQKGSLSKWQAINRAIASGLQPSRTRLDKSAFSLKKFSRSHANDWIMSKRHTKRTELAELNDRSMFLPNNDVNLGDVIFLINCTRSCRSIHHSSTECEFPLQQSPSI